LSYEEQKEQTRRIRKLEKSVAEAEQKITSLETEISTLETRMATIEGASDANLYTEHARLKTELASTMDIWTEAIEQLEKERI